MLLVVVIVCVLGWFGWRKYNIESFTGSPYDAVQQQAGLIQSIEHTINTVTISESSIDALQTESDQTTTQINQLQTNLPSSATNDEYA